MTMMKMMVLPAEQVSAKTWALESLTPAGSYAMPSAHPSRQETLMWELQSLKLWFWLKDMPLEGMTHKV